MKQYRIRFSARIDNSYLSEAVEVKIVATYKSVPVPPFTARGKNLFW